ncbi:nucleotidyltransferase family protein [Dyella caseinilytica]|uniref:Nucleotidyltransferase family protein n=1 Tax=Dyella caseinilytica TaxID=1849581 RepID=A0ABX7GZ50_9GAMM|nr:nucleotidyltransferase family protein [Dyella caseinilytica]QRN55605.1 nucleotidyltransferase family protein [Dyella caseinilytica]GGA03010.1 hypothetical protein GCM10011408_25640 [Dyella caseinilytica]
MHTSLPPLKIVRDGLHRATEALARELARPGSTTPEWSDMEWQLAAAAAAAHGVAPLLSRYLPWQEPAWRAFVRSQSEHVELRHRRIIELLASIDASTRAAGIAVIPLKGCALHAIGLYAPGERPMADIDLLVHEEDLEQTGALLCALGYVQSFTQWKHQVFKPTASTFFAGLGEHRDTPINIELHTRIQERLPIAVVDITEQVYPGTPTPGLNAYPSSGALMAHLLLHAAGNICGHSMRLLHLNDISLLATRMTPRDWNVLWEANSGKPPWWALPPLYMVSRYYTHAVPRSVLARLQRDCPTLLQTLSRRRTLTHVSCSALWLNALPGIEWSRSPSEAIRCIIQRFRPTAESVKERADMVRTQLWLQGQNWVTASHARRILTRLIRPVPRMDTLYAVRAAFEHFGNNRSSPDASTPSAG